MIQSLIVAHRCAVDQLERLENEEVEERNFGVGEQSSSANEEQSATTAILRLPTKSRANRMPWLFDHRLVYPPATQGSVKQKRASAWASDLIFDNSPLPSGFRRQTWGDGISSSDMAQRADYLIQKWTDEALNMNDPKDQNQNGIQQGSQEISGVKIEEHVELRGNGWKSTRKSTAGSENTIESRPSDLFETPLIQPHHLTKLPPVTYVKHSMTMRLMFEHL